MLRQSYMQLVKRANHYNVKPATSVEEFVHDSSRPTSHRHAGDWMTGPARYRRRLLSLWRCQYRRKTRRSLCRRLCRGSAGRGALDRAKCLRHGLRVCQRSLDVEQHVRSLRQDVFECRRSHYSQLRRCSACVVIGSHLCHRRSATTRRRSGRRPNSVRYPACLHA